MQKGKFYLLALSLVGAVALSLFINVEKSDAEFADILMNSKTESMEKAQVKPVVFPHWFHRIRFKCKVCHEDIFILRAGANDIDMRKIMQGEFCGKCHNGLIAWEPLYCDRCHSYTGK